MEAFRYLFDAFEMNWALPLVAGITAFGALGMMSTWIVGPSRGLLATAQDGELPRWFHKVNKHNMPTSILITQAIIVTVLSFVFLFMPSVSSSYWILLALASMLYMLMYLLMFAAAIRLRKTHPNVHRIYRVPGGKWGIWAISLLGIFGSAFGFFIGFFPPAQIETGEVFTFELFLVGGTALFTLLPFWIYAMRKESWRPERSF
jgi:amino acid transporter